MEGLLLAQVLAVVRDRLPAERLAWRFVDEHTAVLPLVPSGSLWIFDRPPTPRIEFRCDPPPAAAPAESGFQQLLAARAVGPLQAARQPALDRVARFRFGPGGGFVDTPPVELVVEATGRNANLVLLDEDESIVGVAREIGPEVNRYRQLRPGLAYRPPPPYDKLDPRQATDGDLAGALYGRRAQQLGKRVDGFGPELSATVQTLSGVAPDERLEGDSLAALVLAVREVVNDPAGTAKRALGRTDVATLRARERREADRRRLATHLRERRKLAAKRLSDAERTLAAAADAGRLRTEADLLLAYAGSVPEGAANVRLPGFDAADVDLQLDPARSAVANAEQRYAQARRRESRAERAAERAVELRQELEAIDRSRDAVDSLDDETLRRRVDELETEKAPRRTGPGLRYPAPHGFTVVVGRSAKENDEVTFKLARSRDVWLHVQGWHGSHVVILAQGREVPFDTVLYAARLAAGHSKAVGGDNVPVDYTVRKNVWKVKGAAAGTVHYAQQKTVFVTPSRNPATDSDQAKQA